MMHIEPFYETLRVKSEGNYLKFKAAQILSFGNEKCKYVTVKDFKSETVHIDAGFAQQVDSGQVVVLLHDRAKKMTSTILVMRATDTTATALEYLYNRYRKQVLPFIATRPDLVSLVQEKQIAYYNLQTLLHAFNTGQPYPQNR